MTEDHRAQRLQVFAHWCSQHITGDEMGQAQIFIDKVYRSLELPGKHPLKDAHAALDAAVLGAYGFSPKADLLQQLLDLNHAVAARESANDPVTAPGVPPSYSDPASLITEDCIRP